MASFEVAYNFMMDNEDRARDYEAVPDAPSGAHAISGINSASFPGEFAAIVSSEQSQRPDLIKKFYLNHFWNKWLAQINSDDLCKRVFDASVNCGPRTAIEILQRAINPIALKMAAPGSYLLIIDGAWGRHTVESANALDPARLVPAFCAERVLHYQAIVAANPADAVYLAAWTARALK